MFLEYKLPHFRILHARHILHGLVEEHRLNDLVDNAMPYGSHSLSLITAAHKVDERKRDCIREKPATHKRGVRTLREEQH